MLVRIITADLGWPDKQVRFLMTEGCPVLADHLHGDQVVGGGGQRPGAAKQRVCVMLPPVDLW